MNIYQRFGYYLGGFAIGLVILAFFLSGKKTSCDYGPNARTTKNISSKRIIYSDNSQSVIQNNQLDSITVINLIKYGEIDFSSSNTDLEPCKEYVLTNTYKKRPVKLNVKNCDSVATITLITFETID